MADENEEATNNNPLAAVLVQNGYDLGTYLARWNTTAQMTLLSCSMSKTWKPSHHWSDIGLGYMLSLL